MTTLKNPSEVGSAFRGLEGDASASPSSFSIEWNSRRLFFRVAIPRRVIGPTFKSVVVKVDALLGSEAARMLTLEGGPHLVSHVLVRPWTRDVPLSFVEQVVRETELSLRELGYRDLTANIGD